MLTREGLHRLVRDVVRGIVQEGRQSEAAVWYAAQKQALTPEVGRLLSRGERLYAQIDPVNRLRFVQSCRVAAVKNMASHEKRRAARSYADLLNAASYGGDVSAADARSINAEMQRFIQSTSGM